VKKARDGKSCDHSEKPLILRDSIIKEARPEVFDVAIHGRPPTSKDKLRYSKFGLYEQEIKEEHLKNVDDDFKRIEIVSN
jgi:hypothetical protein